MELRQLSTFCNVVDSGGIGAAAKALGFAQSTVTAQIQGLEASIGSDLFVRDGKRLALTPAGRTVYERARDVLRGVDELRDALGDIDAGAAGEVRLGAIESAASSRVPDALAAFLRDRPRVRVHLETGGTAHLCRRVAAGELDFAVSAMPPGGLGIASIAFERLYVERLGLLVHANDPLAERATVRLRDLARHRILLTDAACSYNACIREACARAEIDLDVALESANIATLKRAVQLEMGSAVVPLAELKPAPARTRAIAIEGASLRVMVGLVRRRSVRLSPAAETLAASLVSSLARS
jgi:DNA-binding transcriptional LysR family regulator